MYACMHAAPTCMHIHMNTCTHTYIQHTHDLVHVSMHTYTETYINNAYTETYINKQVLCIYSHIQTFRYKNIHTYTGRHALLRAGTLYSILDMLSQVS